MKNKSCVSHDKVMAKLFSDDPDFVQASLSLALEEGNMKEFLILMRKLAEANGGIPAVAKKAGLHEKSLYRTLSESGNPRFTTVTALMGAMGMKLTAKSING